MKSTNQTIKFINHLIQRYLEKPESYSPSPLALEEVLIHLDLLKQFVCDYEGSAPDNRNRRYFDFLRSQGFGVSTFSGWPENATMSDAVMFQKLSELWRKYIASNPDDKIVDIIDKR